MELILTVLAVVALILAVIELARSTFQSLLAWAVVLLAIVIVVTRLPG